MKMIFHSTATNLHPIFSYTGPNPENAECKDGNFFHMGEAKCKPCDYGYYQPSGVIDLCYPCGEGKTTSDIGSTHKEQCKSKYVVGVLFLHRKLCLVSGVSKQEQCYTKYVLIIMLYIYLLCIVNSKYGILFLR